MLQIASGVKTPELPEHLMSELKLRPPSGSFFGSAAKLDSRRTEKSVASSSPLKIVYRVVSWSVLVVLALTLVLALHKPPVPEISYDPTAAARVQQKFAAADQAEAAGAPASVDLDAAELNSYLRGSLGLEASPQTGASSSASNAVDLPDSTKAATGTPAVAGADANGSRFQATVTDVRIAMAGDVIKAYVIFDFHGKDLSLELDGHLGAQNGYLTFRPVAGKFGSLPLPQSALDAAVERLTSSPQNRESLKLPSGISNLQVADGHLVITYN